MAFDPKWVEKYGAQAALAESNPEIMALIEKALNDKTGVWGKDKFMAEFMNTAWFRNHSIAWRNAAAAQAADPGEYASSLKKVIDQIKRQAIQNGIVLDETTITPLATSLLNEYWGSSIPTDVLNARLGSLTKFAKVVGGKMMSVADSLKEYSARMGIKFDASYFDTAAKSIMEGTATIEQWQQSVKDAAKTRFPMFAAQIDAGATVDQIASPYKQTMSSVLELPYDSIMLDDPTIAKAFGSVNKDGQPAVMGLWDFEKSLKNDPRWNYTKNARAAVDSVARKVLTDFGLAY